MSIGWEGRLEGLGGVYILFYCLRKVQEKGRLLLKCVG